MTKYFITCPIQGDPHDGSIKPKRDVVDFLRDLNFNQLSLTRYQVDQRTPAFVNARLDGELDDVQSGDVVVHQFPMYNGYPYERLILDKLHQLGAQVIGLIHDLDYLRYNLNSHRAPILAILNEMDALIVMTPNMKQKLKEEGITTPMVSRGPWDYQTHAPLTEKRFANQVYMAGNISADHSGYLQALPKGLNVTAFGPKFDEMQLDDHVNYAGIRDGEMIGADFEGGFGLVWNSDSLNAPQGKFSEYMQLTWLHKFSVYLSAGLPVIVWSQTYMADFVRQNNLGLLIDNLEELPAKIEAAKANYPKMAHNALRFAKLLREGFYTKQSTLAALEALATGGVEGAQIAQVADSVVPSQKSNQRVKKETWMVVTGTIRDRIDFDLMMIKAIEFRNQGIIKGIVLSTWRGELAKFPDIQAKLDKFKIIVVESYPLRDSYVKSQSNSVNYWRQAVQIQSALDVLPDDVFVFKARTDRATEFIDRFTVQMQEGLYPVHTEGHFPQIFQYQIAAICARTTRIMQFRDFVFFAYKDDVRRILNFSVSELQVERALVANIQFFALPFIQNFAIMRDYYRMVSYKNLVRANELYFSQGGDDYPTLLMKVYATYFQILDTHFDLVAEKDLGPLARTPIFGDFFAGTKDGHIETSWLGTVIQSNQVLTRFLASQPTDRLSSQLLQFSKQLHDHPLYATQQEFEELYRFSAQQVLGKKVARWIFNVDHQPAALAGSQPVPEQAADDFFTPIAGLNAEQNIQLREALKADSNIRIVTYHYWKKMVHPSPLATQNLVLPNAKAGSQIGIVTLARLLRYGLIADSNLAEVERVILFNSGIMADRDTADILTILYRLNYYYAYADHPTKMTDDLRQLFLVDSIKKFAPDVAEEVLGTSDVGKQVAAFKHQWELLRANKSSAAVRDLLQLMVEVTNDPWAYATLMELIQSDRVDDYRVAWTYLHDDLRS